MHTIRVNDIELSFRLHGRADAPVLALVNSLGSDARIWDAMIERLAGRFRIVSYDKRGHGRSGAPAADYGLDQHVADLAALLDHLAIKRLALCGVSVGGLIAQGFALRHPDRLAALVLCDTAARIGDAAMWNDRIATVRAGGLAAILDPVMQRWFTDHYRQSQPAAMDLWRDMFLAMPVDGYVGTCATLRDTDLREAVHAIAAPTLVVVGEEDLSTPVALVRDTAERITGARFEIIAGAGHIPSIERPEDLAQLISSFLHEVGYD